MKLKQQPYSYNHVKMGNLKAITPHWGVRAPYHSGATPAVIHPDVRFKELPFYSVIDNIIRPTALGRVLVDGKTFLFILKISPYSSCVAKGKGIFYGALLYCCVLY